MSKTAKPRRETGLSVAGGAARSDSAEDMQPPTWFAPALSAAMAAAMETCMAGFRDAISAQMTKVDDLIDKYNQDLQATKVRVTKIEESNTEYEAAIVDLRKDILEKDKHQMDAIMRLEAKLDDFENRQRRKNIRISGFPEGIEGRNAIAFLQEWLPKILDLPDSKWEIERAHRTLVRAAPDQGRPRAFVIKLLRFQDVAQILAASRAKKELFHGNSRIYIFPDRSPSLHKKIMAFTPIKRLLRQAGLVYGVRYPAILRVELKDGGSRSFDSAGAAESFLRKACPELSW